MKKISMALALAGIILLPAAASAVSPDAHIDPCLGCHDEATPSIVKEWQESKHSAVGVKCYVCHKAQNDDAGGTEHNGYLIVTAVPLAHCETCHPRNARTFMDRMRNQEGEFSHNPRVVGSAAN